MLKALSNNRAGLHKELGLLICMVLLAGCQYITQESAFTEWDYKLRKQGYILECTDYRDERCVVVQWINGTTNSTRPTAG